MDGPREARKIETADVQINKEDKRWTFEIIKFEIIFKKLKNIYSLLALIVQTSITYFN